jgi:hypothetical protein
MRYRTVKLYERGSGKLIFATLEVEGEGFIFPWDFDGSRIGSREYSNWVEADYHPLLIRSSTIEVD